VHIKRTDVALHVAARCPLFYDSLAFVAALWPRERHRPLMQARYICTHARACIKRSRLYNQRSASENEMASARRACGRIGNCTRAHARIRARRIDRASGSKFRARRRRSGSVLFRIRSWRRRARNDSRSVITGLRFHKWEPAAAAAAAAAAARVYALFGGGRRTSESV